MERVVAWTRVRQAGPLGVAVGCLAVACGWCLLRAAGVPVPLGIMRVVVPAAHVAAGLAAWSTAGIPGLAPGARRFWRRFGWALLLVAVFEAVRIAALAGTGGPLSPVVERVLIALILLAVLMYLFALIRLPVPARPPAVWVRTVLDGVAVIGTAAMLFWYLGVRPRMDDPGSLRPDVTMLLIVIASSLVAIVALLKVTVLGTGPVSQRAAGLLTASVLTGPLIAEMADRTAGTVLAGLDLASTVAQATLFALAAHLQAVDTRRGAPARDPLSPGSLLPSLAVAANSVLMTFVAYGDPAHVAVVSSGTVAVSTLVFLRQLLALRDNRHLLADVRSHQVKLLYETTHDPLTGLVNRARFTALADEMITDPTVPSPAVALVDLDDFKLVNDTYGHAVGDEALVAVAHRLREAVREVDVVGRLGGDEFGVLVRDADGVDAADLGRRIRELLAAPVGFAAGSLLVRASIGVAVAGDDDRGDGLLQHADLAMYAAKDRGKDAFVVYTPGMKTRMVAHAQLGVRLRAAIAAGELFLEYQPIVELDTGRVAGTEALVRWRDPERGVVPPAEFIPAAEQTGLVVPLGWWVLRAACAQQATWLRELGPAAPGSVSVNIAGRQLTEPDIVERVVAALADSGLSAAHLVIEVTETAVLDDESALAALHALRDLSIRIALDDFGTASSSLGLLLTCPVTTLKLDRSFVTGITTVARQEAVATAVIRMAQALDLSTVAEGIETEEQARMLRDLGYRHGQGYLYGRPLSPAALGALVTATPTPV